MRFEHGAHAVGRRSDVANFARDVLEMRPHFGEIRGDLDLHLRALLRRQIVDMDLAELLVHDAAGPGAGVTDILARCS